MKNKELFKRYYSISKVAGNTFWNNVVNWNSIDYIEDVLKMLNNDLEACNNDLDEIIVCTELFLFDILEEQNHHEKKHLFYFLRFRICTLILTSMTFNKLFSLTFHWLCNSLSDEISTAPNRQYEYDRIFDFYNSDNELIKIYFKDTFIHWTNLLFYYSSCTGGLKELAEKMLEISLYINVDTNFENEQSVKSLCQINSWCKQYKFEKEQIISGKFLDLFFSFTTVDYIKKDIALHFSCNPSSSTKSRKKWIEIITNDFSELLNGQEKLQLLVNSLTYDVTAILGKMDDLIRAIKIFQKEEEVIDIKLYQYNINQIYKSIILTLIAILLRNGYIAETNKIIVAFFQIQNGFTEEHSNLFIIPNTKDGAVYCTQNYVLPADVDIKLLKCILETSNEFFGVSHALTDDFGFKIWQPERIGVPDSTKGPLLYNLLYKYFNIEVTNRISVENCNGYTMLFGMELPIQNIMSLSIGKTLPILRSFQKLKPVNKIKKVLIWQGDTQLAEMQRIGMEELFKNKKIEVKYLNCFDANKQDFILEFTKDIYEVVWVLCHGEFEQYAAHDSYLNLGNEIKLYTHEFKDHEYKNDNFRRLLVIDACDGANGMFNTPSPIGLGPSLANSSQSIMSHAWPIESKYGFIIGLLLACNLADADSFEIAHYNTISTFYSGKNKIREQLEYSINNPDIFERLEHSNIDYDNFFYWGSLNYIQ